MYEILDLFQLSSTINSKSFNKKIEDFHKDKLKSELCRIKQNNSGILRFYSKFFGDFELQRYLKLNISKDLRRMLTKLRISAHSLAIETGRYGTTKIPADQRFCKFCPTNVEDEVHFLFQCPQCNLLRNEYDIPFINIYHFNKINDFINPALIHDAKLVCKFIKEAMFLENIHQSTKTNLQTASSFTISSDLLLLLSEMCTCLRFYIQCMNTLTIML